MFFAPLKSISSLVFCCIVAANALAQTDQDAIMMNKNQYCNGFLYNYSSWNHYWEGTLKRNNQNLGTITTQSAMYMGNYGITNNLNIMAALPYVYSKASAGTLHKMSGIQDLAIHIKWRFLRHQWRQHKVAVYAIGGFSTPLSNYTPDFLPLSIGLGSTNLTARAMVDYQYKRFTVTGHAAYIRRNNITIDRDAYYTDRLHLTNEVAMPDMTQLQLRAGYRGKYLIAEAIYNQGVTQGGFDITRNNMPFPSNRMNAGTIGAYAKYTLPAFHHIELLGNITYTVHGRNVGQVASFGAGLFYVFYLNKSSRPTTLP